MPPAIIGRLSKSIRQHQRKKIYHSDSKRQTSGETCPICWKNLPNTPAVLPCGHEFCKGCILDLTNHAKLVKRKPCCPICRGPLERESFKKVWKRACHHHQSGCTLLDAGLLGATSSSATHLDSGGGGHHRETAAPGDERSLNFLTNDVIREFAVAAKQFGECLSILDAEAARSADKQNRRESKKRRYRVATLMKLQEVLKYNDVLPETQRERRIQLLKEVILLSKKPIPKAHLELGKIFLEEQESESLTLAIDNFKIILDLAEGSILPRGAKKHAKKLRGQTHYHVALAHQLEGVIELAANHYELAHKYNSCRDYAMAAKCHCHLGNLHKAINFGKLALSKKQEQGNVKCDTHLLLIVIYEKFFLLEQLEGNLSESKHYKYHQEVENYCDSLIGAKILASDSSERSEIMLRMDTFQCLVPWKRTLMEHHFQAWSLVTSASCRMKRSAFFTEESHSENTYTMGEMEDSFNSNSLCSNSFDHANDEFDDRSYDDSEDDGHFDDIGEKNCDDCDDHDGGSDYGYHNRQEVNSKGAHPEVLDGKDTGDWTSENGGRSATTLEREEGTKSKNGQYDRVESGPIAIDSKGSISEEDSEPTSQDGIHDAKEEIDASIEASQCDSISEIKVDEDQHDGRIMDTGSSAEVADNPEPETESDYANHGGVRSIEACTDASPDDSCIDSMEERKMKNEDDKIRCLGK